MLGQGFVGQAEGHVLQEAQQGQRGLGAASALAQLCDDGVVGVGGDLQHRHQISAQNVQNVLQGHQRSGLEPNRERGREGGSKINFSLAIQVFLP